VSTTADHDRDELLRQVELAAEQMHAWTAQHETLVRQAVERGIPQRRIAAHSHVDQSTVSRMTARHRSRQPSRP
jgi:hypothetical protein